MILATPESLLERARAEWLSHAGDARGIELVIDAELGPEDAYACEPGPNGLKVTASNPRSLFYGVSACLRRLGFAWPVPGKTISPAIPAWENLSKPFSSKAAFETRGWSLEGGFDINQLEASLDWAMRHGLNHVHYQFTDLRTFFRRAVPSLSLEQVLRWDLKAAELATERGMLIHRGGHGFLPVVMGLPQEQGWDHYEGPIDVRALLDMAEIKGSRGLFNKTPSNTQLCLSRPGIGARIAEVLAGYAASHPEALYFALWLGDGTHNWCECPQCKGTLPARLYLECVHLAAEALAAVRPEAKLEFIAYTNILDAPDSIRSLPKNTVFQFAPWGRNYDGSWADAGATPEFREPGPDRYPRFKRWPETSEYKSVLEQWMALVPGTPVTLYEYYLWPYPWRGNKRQDLMATMQADLKWLKSRDVAGMLMCQTPRCHWPDGFLAGAQAALLWDPETDLAALKAAWPKGDSEALKLASEFYRFEDLMETGAKESLETYLEWLKSNEMALSDQADLFDLKIAERFGLPWHRGVGWSFC